MKNNKIKRFRTDFLFTLPSILSSIGSFFSFSSMYYEYNRSKTGAEADYKALSSDWNMIGQDLNDSIIFSQADNELKKIGKEKNREERQLQFELDG